MKILHQIRHIIDKVLAAVCIFLFALMVVVGTYQIVTRYFFNRPSTVSEELLTYSFTWMALLISAYVFGKRDHMRMAFLADKVTGKARVALESVIELLITAFAAIVPWVAICETRCAPYLCETYSMTSSRRSMQKSTSKSGMETRSGVRKRSKKRS